MPERRLPAASVGPSEWSIRLQRGAPVICMYHTIAPDAGCTEAPSLDKRWGVPLRPRHPLDSLPPDQAQGHPDRPPPLTLAGLSATDRVPGMLTGHGRVAQLGVRELIRPRRVPEQRLPRASVGPYEWPTRLQRGAPVIYAHQTMAHDTGCMKAPLLG